MVLSSDVISEFAKSTKDTVDTKNDLFLYGTIVDQNGTKYVRFDGSTIATPLSSTTNIEHGERVTVAVKNHSAIVTGNITSPAARTVEVEYNTNELGNLTTKITEAETNITKNSKEIELMAKKTEVNEVYADIGTLEQRVTNAEAAIELQADQIELKVSKSTYDTDMKTKASTQSVEAVQNGIDNNTEAISALGNRVTNAEAAIELQADQIELKVSKSQMNDAVNSVQVGGRNLILNSGVEVSGSDYFVRSYTPSSPLISGDVYTVSLCATPASGVKSFSLHASGGMGIVTSLNVTGTEKQVLTKTFTMSYYPGYTPDVDATYAVIRLHRQPNDDTVTGTTTVHWIKIEKGNKATDWTPAPEDPASSVKTESSVLITEEQVRIATKEFEVSIPSEDGDISSLVVNEDGVTARIINAPNVSPRYSGYMTVTVNPNASSTDIDAGWTFRGLSDAFAALNGRQIDGNVVINCVDGTEMYGDVTLYGVCGGSITINGIGSTLNGSLTLSNCSSKILINKLTIVVSSGDALVINGGLYTGLWDCTLKSDTGNALSASEGARVYVVDSTLISGGNTAAFITTAAFGVFSNCIGTGELATQFASLAASGTVPSGGCNNWGGSLMSADNVTPTSGGTTPDSQIQTTVTYLMNYSDSYCGGWSWVSDNDVRQGFTNGRSIYGVIWFDSSAIQNGLTGKTIKQASLRLYMWSGVGRGAPVSVQLYGTNMAYDGRTGAPERTRTYGTIGTTNPGEVNVITIPVSVVQDLATGVIKALVLLSDDTTVYNGRAYSKNYARFSGSTSCTDETIPALTVIYQ